LWNPVKAGGGSNTQVASLSSASAAVVKVDVEVGDGLPAAAPGLRQHRRADHVAGREASEELVQDVGREVVKLAHCRRRWQRLRVAGGQRHLGLGLDGESPIGERMGTLERPHLDRLMT
jgi:hypothetical protein